MTSMVRNQRNSGSAGVNSSSLCLSQFSQHLEDRDVNSILYFVIPTGETETTCSTQLIYAFQVAVERLLCVKWISEEECLSMSPLPGNVFVLDPFDGPAYKHLESSYYNQHNYEIIGPQCLRFSLESKEECPIRTTGYPMFTSSMSKLVITFSGFQESHIEGNELKLLIRRMNGVVLRRYTMATTHIVAKSVLTDKCTTAYDKEMPVMTADWIRAVWKDSQCDLIEATHSKYVKYACPIFYNLTICVSQVPVPKKNALKNIIDANGGKYSAELVKNVVDVLVVPKAEGEKYRYASQWGVPCVTPDWVESCKEVGHMLPVRDFIVSGLGKNVFISTPTSTKLAEHFADLTSMTGIPNCSKLEVDETYMSTRPESSVRVNPEDLDIVKRASNTGPYLDGCKVYLCGSEKLEQVRKLLNASGATRLDRLSENVTHVLVAGPKIPEKDMEAIKRLDFTPYLVGVEWLVESAKQGSSADEELYAYAPENKRRPSSSSGSEVNVNTNHGEISALVERKSNKNSFNRTASSNGTINSYKNISNAIPNPIQTTNWSAGSVTLNDVTVGALINLQDNFGVAEAEQDNFGQQPIPEVSTCKIPPVCSTTGSEDDASDSDACDFLFIDIKCTVNLSDPLDKSEVEDIIQRFGGVIVEKDADVLILPVVYSSNTDTHTLKLYTKFWVNDCVDSKSLDIPHCFHYLPLKNFEGMSKILKDVVIATSQYGSQEKDFLAALAVSMGATYQDVFSRKDSKDKKIQRSTHLICSGVDNEKFKAAEKWSVPVVVSDWMLECYAKKELVDVKPYHPNQKYYSDISYIPKTPKGMAPSKSSKAFGMTSVMSVYPGTGSKVVPAAPVRMEVVEKKQFLTPKSKHSVPFGRLSTSSISDVETSVANSMNGNISGLELVTVNPVEESPLMCGLSRDASRQLKRALNNICSDSPGPDTSHLDIKRRISTPDHVVTDKVWAFLRKKYPGRDKNVESLASPLTVVRLPVVNNLGDSVHSGDSRDQTMYEEKSDEQPLEDDGISMKITPQKSSPTKKQVDHEEEDYCSELISRRTKKRTRTTDSDDCEDVTAERSGNSTGSTGYHSSVNQGKGSAAGSRNVSNSPVRSKRSCVISEDFDKAGVEEHVIRQNRVETELDVSPLKSIMGRVVAFISKKCEDMEEQLKVQIQKMGGKVVDTINSDDITHFVAVGKLSQLSRDIKKMNAKNRKIKVVKPEWVQHCYEKKEFVNEEFYDPTLADNQTFNRQGSSSSLNSVRTTRSKSNAIPVLTSKASLDTLSNILQANIGDRDIVSSTKSQCPNTSQLGQKNIVNDHVSNMILTAEPKHLSEFQDASPPIDWVDDVNSKQNIETATRGDRLESAKQTKITKVTPLKQPVEKSSNEVEIITNRRVTRNTGTKTSNSVAGSCSNSVQKKPVGADHPQSSKKLNKHPVFMISGLTEPLKVEATKIIQQLGGDLSQLTTYDSKADAIIAGSLARSEKVLGSIAAGKFVLQYSFVTESSKANKFLPLEDFMWNEKDGRTDQEKMIASTVLRWFNRISQNPNRRPFTKLRVFFAVSDRSKVLAYIRLVEAGGGRVFDKLNEANIIIADNSDAKGIKNTDNLPIRNVMFLNNVITNDIDSLEGVV